MSTEGVWLLSFLLVVSFFFRVLSIDFVCSRVENRTFESLETYMEPVTVETYTWCLQIPPRCLKTRTEMRQRSRPTTRFITLTLDECCEGYRPKYRRISLRHIRKRPRIGFDTLAECVPICENGCGLFGHCTSPGVCQCMRGFAGKNCLPCATGTWGDHCELKCDCPEDGHCNVLSGECRLCPAGFRGRECNMVCKEGFWGQNCTSPCPCIDSRCNAHTGACVAFGPLSKETMETLEATNITIPGDQEESSEYPTETTEMIETTTEAMDEVSVATDDLATATSPETTPDRPEATTRTTEVGSSSTVRPMFVVVSVPEERRNLETDKFAMKSTFLGQRAVDEDHLHEMPPVKSDYVKNIHKDMMHLPSIPLDIALIVVASIISLGLTSVAVVMVLHMRSKLLETARVSIYEVEKTKGQDNTGTIDKERSPSFVNTLPRSPIREMPAYFTSTPEAGAILTIPSIDPTSNYANGAATIGLRISGTLRDFLQDGHYDRPPSTQIRLQTFSCETTPEHIYDEIPLQSSPMCPRRSVTEIPIDRESTRADQAAGSRDLAQLIR